jgi:restriction system protein
VGYVDYLINFYLTSMAIPDFQSLMLPVLRLASDGQEVRFRDAVDKLADDFRLTDEDRATLLPSGTQPLFTNRVGWARTYLKQAGLIQSTRRGFFRITEEGRALLSNNPVSIDSKTLEQFPSFRHFRERKRDKVDDQGSSQEEFDDETPDDAMARAYKTMRADLETRLLETLKETSPSYFEKVVVELLVRMGYGGSREEAGRAIGRSGDGGIDGIIDEDRLGLDVVYVQAKRYTNGTIGRPDIQRFAGALQGQRARKGVFITTTEFSREARDYVSYIDSRIVLINGERLARLMVDHGVGVTTVGTYEVKKIDLDYFSEDE